MLTVGAIMYMIALGGGRIGNLEIPPPVLLVASVVVAVVVNAGLVWTALSPLRDLQQTLESVRSGDLSARVPESLVADPYLSTLRNTTNRMLDHMARSQQATREVSMRLIRSEEEARERVADALYGGSAQTLAGILVRLQILLRKCSDATDREMLEDLRGEVVAALDEVRALARQLHPPELEELGVQPAVAAHARHLSSDAEMRVEIRGGFREDELPEDAKTALFRVLTEALTNAHHHADAESITLTYVPGELGIEAVVEDDGKGFDPGSIGEGFRTSRGLLVIRERAGYARGWASLETAPGAGTRVRIFLPWAGAQVPADRVPLVAQGAATGNGHLP
jgi:signal transduction histidine kinase